MERSESLKELILKSNKIGDEGMTHIAGALHGSTSKIHLLNLTQTGITADSVKTILFNLKTDKTSHLRQLILDRNNLNTTYNFNSISYVVAAAKSLQVLSFADCNLADTFGLPFAEALKSNRGLQKVNLSHNEMTSKTLSSIANALKETCAPLKELDLSKNCFDDKGGIKLGEAIRSNRILVKLNLSNNNFTDETAMAFNRNMLSSRLEEIDFRKNLINLRVLEMLATNCEKIRNDRMKDQLPQKQFERKRLMLGTEGADDTRKELDECRMVMAKHQKRINRQREENMKMARVNEEIDERKQRRDQFFNAELREKINELNAIMATFSLEKEKANFNERYESKIEDKQEEIEDRLKEIGIIEEKIRQIKQGQEFDLEIEEKAHQN